MVAPVPGTTPTRSAGAGEWRKPFVYIAGDPLRGLAAVAVLCHHSATFSLATAGGGAGSSAQWRRAYGAWGGPLQAFALANIFFFVLSGYLIARPFVRAFVYGRRMPAVGVYLRNRVLRVFPAMWAVFTGILLATGLFRQPVGHLVRAYLFSEDWTSNFPLASAFGQAWTLNVEVRFYLLVAVLAVVATVARRGRLRTAGSSARAGGLAAATALAWIVLLALFWHAPWRFGGLPLYLFAFVPGIALAAAEPLVAPRLEGRSWTRLVGAAAAVAGAAVLIGLQTVLGWVGSAFGAHFIAIPGVSRVVIVAGIVGVLGGTLVAQWGGYGCSRVLDNPVLRWLGTRSYSFYLLHLVFVTHLVKVVAQPSDPVATLLLLIPAAAVPTLLLAEVSYRLVEAPFLRRRRHLTPTADTGPDVKERRRGPALYAGDSRPPEASERLAATGATRGGGAAAR